MGELLLVCWVVWPWLSYSQKRHKSKGESDANQEGYGDDYGGTAWRWQVVPVIMIISHRGLQFWQWLVGPI
jgi:hypothetical protein